MQHLITGLIVFAAIAFIVHSAWRTYRASKGGCGGGCSCGPKEPAQPKVISLEVSRVRKPRDGYPWGTSQG